MSQYGDDDVGFDPFDDDEENEEYHSDTEEGVAVEAKGNVYGIGDPRRITSKNGTSFERSELIGKRALMLDHDFAPVDNRLGLTDAIEIATDEFNRRIIPIDVERSLPNGDIEIWSVTELNFPKE